MRFFVFGVIRTMNILIVGNGFDLSHWLPTKYDHFMDVMGAIEEKDTGGLPANLENIKLEDWLEQIDKMFEKRKGFEPPPHHMNFDELFAQTRDPNFIEKTKEYYLTENIEICSKDVLKLQYRLEMNCWYRYFKSHVEEIKTWIDFEEKIKGVIYSISNAISFITEYNEANEYRFSNSKLNAAISKRTFGVLKFFDVFEGERAYKSFNPVFCNGEDVKNGFSLSSLLEYAQKQLDEFIEIFNLYLELIVSQLQLKCTVEIAAEDWLYPDKIFSFNYTNTFLRIHNSVKVEYLHGSHGKFQNIVLGISDLEDNELKKLKAYGFTKYHQKLFKDTDYLFLDNFIKESEKRHKNYELKKNLPDKEFQPANAFSSTAKKDVLNRLRLELNPKMNIRIWGHSLDISDKDYIIDLFSLNDDIDRNVRVIVYYFDQNAKFALLNNLLAILEKDKVEQWMKNKWLQFKPNPEIKFNEMISEKTA